MQPWRLRLLLDFLLNFEEAVELADARGVPHFAEGFGFDLANAFARDPELFADFFEGAGIAVAQAEAQFENFALALIETSKHVAEFVFEQSETGDLGGAFGAFVLDEIAEVSLIAVADR